MHSFDNASLILPAIKPLPQVLGEPRLRTDILRQIQSDEKTSTIFQNLSLREQEAFLEFCMGNRGLKITYDPFFLHIFNPAIHPNRLNRFLSCILKQNVTIKEVLPRERQRISENSSLTVMDILTQLSDNRLVNVEMQRIGYDFPIQRSFCYGADLLIRQYDIVRENYRYQNHNFSYRHISPIYIIVLMEESPSLFHQYPDKYMHCSQFSFDTGLNMEQLENFIFISLDIFRQIEHNEFTELEAWLYFLSSDQPENILRIIDSYPFFQELYQDIIKFRYQPKEMITMFSEALSIMDRNTVEYMTKRMAREMANEMAYKMARETEKKLRAEMQSILSEKDSEIKRLHTLLAQYEKDT